MIGLPSTLKKSSVVEGNITSDNAFHHRFLYGEMPRACKSQMASATYGEMGHWLRKMGECIQTMEGVNRYETNRDLIILGIENKKTSRHSTW